MEILEGILTLLTGCGVFLIGMRMMSDGLESSAGSGMKKLFQKISSNRFSGVGVGAAATAIIQSSAATTVMVIGFVNAGIMTLAQAAAIIMGANIGTTVTGLLVSLSAFDIGMYAAALAFVGVVLMFVKKDIVKKVGGILCGLGLVFVGLDMMSGALAFPDIKKVFVDVFTSIEFPLLLILVGIAFTAIAQSSSVITSILIILAGQGAIGVENALFIVLGTNIGTCITSLIASIGTNVNARRAAFIHLLFNVLGTLVFLPFVWIFKDVLVNVLGFISSAPQMQIAWFHVFFNVITTAVLLPFLKLITRFVEYAIKDKKVDNDELKFAYIDDRLLGTPAIATAQVKKEIINMARLAKENTDLSLEALLKKADVDRAIISANEAKINFYNHGIARYLIKLSSLSVSQADEERIGSYHHVISDIERIGDHAENFIEQVDDMDTENIAFSADAVTELDIMYSKVGEMFKLALTVFESGDKRALIRLSRLEEEVDGMKSEITLNHIKRLNAGDCAVERGAYLFAVISGLERVADHLVNIGFSVSNPIGSQNKVKSIPSKQKRDNFSER